MHIQSVLQQLGYPMNQVKIYLVSLKMGEAKIADIAVQVAMPRSTVAEVVEEMHKQGLINYYNKKGRKYWMAENPEKLMAMLKLKEASFRTILPQLLAMRNNSGEGKPIVQVYTGIDGIKLILEDMLDVKHSILSLVSEDDFWEAMGVGYMDEFIERRKERFLPIKFIVPFSARALKLKLSDSDDLRKTRFLPRHIELKEFSNYIYGNKVAVISLNHKEPTGIIIEDPNVSMAMTVYFESLWHHSTEK